MTPRPAFSCSHIARSTGEPLYGTAPTAQAWILLEQSGPWGPDAVFESDLPGRLAAELTRRTRPLGIKTLLIRRRPGRYDSPETTCYLAHSGRAGAWMEELSLTSPSDLLDVEFEAVASPEEAPGLGPATESAFLVCTHSRRDPCCAEYGRALMKVLGDELNVWESSHLGGHRFAANLACFPHGLFYGQVEGAAPVESFRAGAIYLPNYRGRSTDEPVVQSAEYLLRCRENLTGIDDLVVEAVTAHHDSARVSFAAGPTRYVIDLVRKLGEPRPESCNKPKLTVPELWELAGP